MKGSCFAGLLALLVLGCAGISKQEAVFEQVKGEHPTNWLSTHWVEFGKNPDQCRTCHGSTTDPAKGGGISKVSCFSCHVDGIGHPANWALPTLHGRAAQAEPVAAPDNTVPTMAGFAVCTKCHGSSFDNGAAVSCKACHTTAPHPARPWTSKTVGTPSHVNTAYGNAPECAKCHTAGANSTMKPLITPPAGTAPGCFNETLCHGTNITRP